MKELFREHKTGKIKLLPENLDDLWHLHNLVSPGDMVWAVTYRREESKGDKLRAERGEKKRMFLGIEVEKVEFQDFSDRLRIHGTITEGPQDLGSYHTFNLTVGDDITIQKERWTVHQQRMIEDAKKAAHKAVITFLAIEDGEALLCVLHQYGVREVAYITHTVPGKQYDTKAGKKDFYDEVLEHLTQSYKGDAPLLIVGPGFAKDELYRYGREKRPDTFEQAHLLATGQAGKAGIQEALRSGSAVKLLEGSRVAYETELVERLMEEIGKSGSFAYGLAEVRKATKLGAIQTLLVTNIKMREPEPEAVMSEVELQHGEVVIISTSHEAGKRLERMGGIGALLRYKLG